MPECLESLSGWLVGSCQLDPHPSSSKKGKAVELSVLLLKPLNISICKEVFDFFLSNFNTFDEHQRVLFKCCNWFLVSPALLGKKMKAQIGTAI